MRRMMALLEPLIQCYYWLCAPHKLLFISIIIIIIMVGRQPVFKTILNTSQVPFNTGWVAQW